MLKIPSKPNIKLKNFLYELDDYVRVFSSVNYMRGTHLKTNKTYKNISNLLGIPEGTYKQYINNTINPTLRILKLMEKFDKSLIKKYYSDHTLYTVRSVKVNLPKEITPRLSYFIGYLQGDGFIGSDKKTYAFSDENISHLEDINRLNKRIFFNKGQIRMKRSKLSGNLVPCLEIRQKVINSYFHNVFDIPRGIKNNLKVPALFYKNKEILRWYLRGLFDADGTLPNNPKKVKQPFIDIALKNKEFVNEIKNILKSRFFISSLELYPKKSKSPSSGKINITWELRIRKFSEIKKFLKEIGFCHINKSKRAQELMKILPE